MTLEEVKSLLSDHNISFEMQRFRNESEYWHHAMLFPYVQNAKQCEVVAIVIKSNNGEKHMELQFDAVDGIFCFQEMRFGEYGFEESDVSEEMLAEDLLSRIYEVRNGGFVVIAANDLKNKRWLGDVCFDMNDDDAVFGAPGYRKAMQRIRNPKRLLYKLIRSKKQYEIYDWNSYQCIVK